MQFYTKLKILANRLFDAGKLKKLPLLAHFGQKMLQREAAEKLKNLHSNGLTVLKLANQAAEECGQELFLNYGTLLGAYRDNAFIPHDNDMDLGCLLNSKQDFETLHKALTNRGFTLYREFTLEDTLLEVTYTCMGVHLDIFFYHPAGDSQYCVYLHERGENTKARAEKGTLCLEGLCLFKGTYKIDGTAPWDFKGVPVKIPANTEEYLVALYTKGWKSPDPNFVADKENTLENLGFVESARGYIYS